MPNDAQLACCCLLSLQHGSLSSVPAPPVEGKADTVLKAQQLAALMLVVSLVEYAFIFKLK